METQILKMAAHDQSLPEAEERRKILDEARLTVTRARTLLASLDDGVAISLPELAGPVYAGRMARSAA